MVDGVTMVDAIERERELLSSVRMRADFVVDTTRLEVSQLRETIISLVTGKKEGGLLRVNVVSFGFKYGIPADADLVFDVRFYRIRIMKSVCAKRMVRIPASETMYSATARRIAIWIICSRCLIS